MIQQMEIFVERELALTVANQFPIAVIRASNWLGKNRRDASLQSDGTILHPLVNEVSVDKYLGNSEPYFYLFILFKREICCQIQKKSFSKTSYQWKRRRATKFSFFTYIPQKLMAFSYKNIFIMFLRILMHIYLIHYYW